MIDIPGTITDVKGRLLDFGTLDNSKPRGGHCCRCLTLHWSFLDLDAAYKAAVAKKSTFVQPETGRVYRIIPDILVIGPMLRLVGVCSENPLGGYKFDEPRKVWRCIYNRPDYTCSLYERRPRMCQQYPNNFEDKKCQYMYCQSTTCPGYNTRGK